MKKQKAFLMEVLEITKYGGDEKDKEEFVKMFLDNVMGDAVYALIHSLPKIKQDKIARKWDNNASNHAALSSILKHYFTPEQLEKASEEAAYRGILGYIRSLDTDFSKQQIEKLRKLTDSMVG